MPLLVPVGRRVRLTPQAEILVAHTEAVLGRLEEVEADIAWSGRPPGVALRELPDGRHARSLFTAVRSGRGHHPAIKACRSALHRAVEAAPPRHPGRSRP